MYETHNKKLSISKSERAFAIFGGICVGVFGVILLIGTIEHMIKTSYLGAPETPVERPLTGH